MERSCSVPKAKQQPPAGATRIIGPRPANEEHGGGTPPAWERQHTSMAHETQKQKPDRLGKKGLRLG